MSNFRLSFWSSMLVAGFVALGCTDAVNVDERSIQPPSSKAGALATPGPAELPFDAARVVDRMTLEFRPTPSGFAAEGLGYSVAVASDGVRVSRRTQDHATAGARFATSSVRRGAQQLSGAARVTTGAQPNEVRIERGATVETLLATASGVEQSWNFASQPRGQGDLVVRVDVEGLPFAAATASGLRFADASGALGYSHATWIDATGRRQAIAAQWRDHAIELRVPAKLVADSTYPAVLDPVIGPETAVDEDVFTTASPRSDTLSRVAFDGTNYLVVWLSSGVYATRVDSSGTVLDKNAIKVGDASAWKLAVDFNGTDYLVAWTETSDDDIHAARVSTAGVVLDPSSIKITNDAPDQEAVDVACDGTNCLVVWEDPRAGTGWDIYGARVAVDGTVLDPGGFVVVGVVLVDEQEPAITFDGSNYLVAYEHYDFDSRDIYAVRVDPDTTVLDAGGFLVDAAEGDQSMPTVAFGTAASGSLVVWRSGPYGYGARVATDGTVTDTTPIDVHVASKFYPPEVAFGSATAGWLVTWYDPTLNNHEVLATRVSIAGAVLDPAGIKVSNTGGNQNWPAVACSGTGYLITWTDSAGATGDIAGKRLSLAGAVLDSSSMLFSTANNIQADVATAWDGTHALLVWSDDRNGNKDIYAARVDAVGNVVDSPAIAVTTDAAADVEPSVAYNGTHYLVVWTRDPGTSADIIAARVSTTGVVLDNGGIVVSSASGEQSRPTVAALGSDFLVAWQDKRTGSFVILGGRVDTDGALRDGAPLLIGVASGDQQSPVASSDGSNWMVAWTDRRAGGYDLYGARVDPDGVILESAGIPISTTVSAELEPAIGFGGGQYLVAWYRNSSGDEIYATRISTGGAVLDSAGIRLTTLGGIQNRPAVAWDGSAFMVAWQNSASTSAPGDDLYATRVSADGAAIVSGAVAIATSALAEGSVALMPRGAGGVLVAYQKVLESPAVSGERVFFGLADFYADGVDCNNAYECQSTYCADGVCCQSACDGNCDSCAAGTGVCSDDDGLCTGNCDSCIAGTCAGDTGLCTGNCDSCSGSGNAFSCAASAALCTGNCDSCAGSGNSFDCQASEGLCTGNCDSCTGSGTSFSCAANDTACTGNCDSWAGGGTSFSCAASDGLCTGNCDSCAGSGNSFDCEASDALCTGNCDSCAGSGNSFDCQADEALCVGNCDACQGGGNSFSCAANDTACTGNCDPCTGGGTSFRCGASDALCTGNCDSCAGSGNQFDCQTDAAACVGNCDVCQGGGNAFNCAADGTACTGNCDRCAGADTDFSCEADATLCTGDCDACLGGGTTFSCDADQTLCPGDCENCTGSDLAFSCQLLTDAVTCRDAVDVCDLAESCSGADVDCPEDLFATTGTECPDSLLCDGTEVCSGGACVAGTALDCDDSDLCTADSCAEPGGCAHDPIDACCHNAGECSDGDDCTVDDCDPGTDRCTHARTAGCCTPLPPCEDGGVDAGCLLDPDQHPECNDDDDCTADRCDIDQCVHETLAACLDAGSDDSATAADAATTDAAGFDAAMSDSATTDSATTDSAATDGAFLDAATADDATLTDSSAPPDTQADDAQVIDATVVADATAADTAASTDTLVTVDAAIPDHAVAGDGHATVDATGADVTATVADAASEDDSTSPGCSCRTSAHGSDAGRGALVVALLAMLAGRRRRRI